MLDRLKAFSLSAREKTGVELDVVDISVGLDEAERSLIGRIFGEKKANLVGIRNTMTKLWKNRGLKKVVALDQNVYQFVFKEEADREGVMKGRPWLFENQLLVLRYWEEGRCWKTDSFISSPLWIQVWNIPPHWISIESGRKIGNLIGPVQDVLIVDAGGREERHVKVLVEVDLSKPLLRGTMLKYKMTECWIEFKYEQLPLYCYYCGTIGHSEKGCDTRRQDLVQNNIKHEQYGYWLRAGAKTMGGTGVRRERIDKNVRDQDESLRDVRSWKGNKGEGEGVAVEAGTMMQVQGTTIEREDSLQRAEAWEGSEGGSKMAGHGIRSEVQGKENQENLEQHKDIMEFCDGTLEVVLLDTGRSQRDEGKISHKVEENECGDKKVAECQIRKALSDCTNSIHIGSLTEGLKAPKPLKKQWKRRARMNILGPQGVDSGTAQIGSAERMKRERGSQDENMSPEDENKPNKKGRLCNEGSCTKFSEVEETSQVWSQPHI